MSGLSMLLVALCTPIFALPNPRVPTWTTLSSIPSPRQEHTTLFLPPSTIAIIGGIIPLDDPTLVPPFATTSLMQFYNITSDTWSLGAPIPKPLNHINAAVVDGKIYVLGGLTDSSDHRGRAWRGATDSWVYDPSEDTWSDISHDSLGAQGRGSAAVGIFNRKIYMAGGITELEFYGNHTQTSVDLVSVFDTEKNIWLHVPEGASKLPEARDHAGGAVVESKMYVLGGRNNGQENNKDTVFVLDLCDLEAGWAISDARMPTARGGIAAGVVGHKVFTFGGEGDTSTASGVFGEVEAYDTAKNTWESFEKMKLPRHGTYAVGVGRKIYIPGGGVEQSGAPVADFDVFTTT
ncbi:hypothetical protein HBI56_141360 [Parastagonospora nodorum]|uniref:Galactose oxidase n=2 Tax=Phaeosphaeria nodorum (strain SN15 / ATCC MYA-4574 / FGSC 10173) TaxID=321614 RepID=A0A7U2NPL1_PHANO|nr:hypothetical protein SNOG_06096 [Parastagonospora nodorum SN15]KAH3911625.1 hypothetical protein HBH56_126480 [Parastagonospora nodorum]EAT87160.1 hypothetical protein SNOG_06096 [Parastagonospora nodorum SN15]KAH3931603.1 hypothetical protein HBH54_097030 [Parastagonospora nodorum]KAH3947429.1 hypothetical protein HBH53_116730 [Parastagonospora nodorum]KAH3970635.1 hypothetical protein HBH51_113190 [Parastagonospora nodorum]